MFEGVKIRTVAIRDVAYEALKRAILTRRLPPGQRLLEEQLTRQLNISRTPLREALQALEREGFVVRLPAGGVQVAPLSVAECENLYAIRRELEGLAAREAARLGAPSCWDEAAEQNAQMLANGERERFMEAYDAGRAFHRVIYTASGNPRLAELLTTLMAQLARYRSFSVVHRFQEGYREHGAILGALRARDPAEAGALSEAHVAAEGAHVLAMIGSRSNW